MSDLLITNAYRTFCEKNKYPAVFSNFELDHYWTFVIEVERRYGFTFKSWGSNVIYARANGTGKYVCFTWEDGFWTINADDGFARVFSRKIIHTDLIRNVAMVQNVAQFLDLPITANTEEIFAKIDAHDAGIKNSEWGIKHYEFYSCH